MFCGRETASPERRRGSRPRPLGRPRPAGAGRALTCSIRPCRTGESRSTRGGAVVRGALRTRSARSSTESGPRSVQMSSESSTPKAASTAVSRLTSASESRPTPSSPSGWSKGISRPLPSRSSSRMIRAISCSATAGSSVEVIDSHAHLSGRPSAVVRPESRCGEAPCAPRGRPGRTRAAPARRPVPRAQRRRRQPPRLARPVRPSTDRLADGQVSLEGRGHLGRRNLQSADVDHRVAAPDQRQEAFASPCGRCRPSGTPHPEEGTGQKERRGHSAGRRRRSRRRPRPPTRVSLLARPRSR